MLKDSKDSTMRWRMWRRVSSYRYAFLFFLCIILSLCLLDPCLIGLQTKCDTDKLYINHEKERKSRPFHVVQKKLLKKCPIFSLRYGDNSAHHNLEESIVCKQTPPLPESCDIANDIFFSEPTGSCLHQYQYRFCHLKKSTTHSWSVSCNATEAKVCSSSLSLGMPNLESGILDWITFNNTQKLANKLTELLRKPDGKHYGFAFISCKAENIPQTKDYSQEFDPYNDYFTQDDSSTIMEQLLILPPSIKQKKTTKRLSSVNFDFNVNIFLIDSTSRQHFFRSLKKSVSTLESIASKPNSQAYVFDFELVQALKSRTFETLQAIFSGYVNVTETPFSLHGIPSKPLNLSSVFNSFRKKSYRTLWLEDLCYLWEWGISKDLHFLDLDREPSSTWKLMWHRLQENGVDDIELTAGMCRILDANGMKDPFRNTNPVCFNGKHQHEYLLEYLRLYQTEMQTLGQPLLTVSSTNVGHEETGRRIQTLDKALADYLSFVSSLDNTFSIIFSDHGNSYGQFFMHSQEAQAELFHPFMFFIIPKTVASKLGPSAMAALKMNTKRLITALDLHNTLLFLANGLPQVSVKNATFLVSEKGLFEPIDPLRTCDTVPRIPPSLCICNSHEVSVDSASYQALFGYHAVGSINSEIQKQFLAGVRDKNTVHRSYGRCQTLQLYKVANVREKRKSGDILKVSMDIHVQHSQVFFVSILVKNDEKDNSHIISLETTTRMTKYGPYQACVDPGVELSLCICNMSSSSSSLKSFNTIPTLSELPTSERLSQIKAIPHFQNSVQLLSSSKGCLTLFTAIHRLGMAIFVANACDKSYVFNMNLQTDKSSIYRNTPFNILLLPGSFEYLALVVNERQNVKESPLHCGFQEVRDLENYWTLLSR